MTEERIECITCAYLPICTFSDEREEHCEEYESNPQKAKKIDILEKY